MALYRVKMAAPAGFVGRVLDRTPQRGAAGLAQRLFADDPRAKAPGASTWDVVKDGVRGAVFGSPVDVVREVRDAGTSRRGNFRLGRGLAGYYKNFFLPKNRERKWWARGLHRASVALNVGLPAVDLAAAAMGPREHRGEALGRSALSLLASPFTARLGLPGALLLSPRIGDLGAAVGRRFDPTPAAYTPTTGDP